MHAMVEAFVTAAEEDDVLLLRELERHALIEAAPCGEVMTMWPAVVSFAMRFDGAKHRLRQHHHPRPAAVRLVVGGTMPIGGVLAQIPHAHIEQPLLDAPRDHALGEERREHVGEDGDEVDAHCAVVRESRPSP